MEPCYAFDPQRYFLGDLCRNGHAFPGTAQSLRKAVVVPKTAKGYGPYLGTLCVACSMGPFRGTEWHWRFLDCEKSGLPVGSKLGKLCPAGHDYCDTGLTLRYKDGKCIECEADRQKRDRRTGKRVAIDRRYRESRKTDPDKKIIDKIRAKAKKGVRRARLKECHHSLFTAQQARQRLARFDGCAYCGAHGEMHMDHFVPLARGGTHALGNLVSACPRCNLSKSDHDPEAWYRAQPFFTEKRWRKILQVLDIKKGSPLQLALL